MKKKVSFTNQHEWMRITAWFNGFTVKVGLTFSYSGVTCRLQCPQNAPLPQNVSKDILKAFKAVMDDTSLGSWGAKMEKVNRLAENTEDFGDFLKALQAMST